MCVGLKSEDSVAEVIEEEGRRWNPYTLTGYISTKNGSTKTPVKVLRDTGATHTLLRACAVPELRHHHTGETLVVKGVGGVIETPVVHIKLQVLGKSRHVSVCLVEELPASEVDVLLGNDVGRGVLGSPFRAEEDENTCGIENGNIVYPACCSEWENTLYTEERVGAEAAVVTRAMSKRDTEGGVTDDATESIRDLFLEFLQRTDHQEVSSHDRVQVEEQELGMSGNQKDGDTGAAAMDEDSSA